MSFPVIDGEPICMANLIRRASVRQLRLHACGCMRLNAPKRVQRKWLQFVETVERYADGEVTDEAFDATRLESQKGRRPRKWGGDLGWGFQSDVDLRGTWGPSINEDRTFEPTESDYKFALPRYRVFEELIGPDPFPHFSAEWRTDTVTSLARQMYDSREFSAMPILADALQDAGCTDEAILAHCRHATHPHLRGCWVLDLVLGK